MKFIKRFESNLNYKVDIFTIKESQKLYQSYLEKYDYNYDLKDKIHYYSTDDFSTFSTSKKYLETCRFIIAYNNDDILGICKFAYFDLNKHYAISYCSTNKDYFGKGIAKKLLEELFKYFSKTYPNEILNFSGYSIEGWKYLRKYILEFSKKYNVKIFEKGVEYPGKAGYSDDFFDLVHKSKEEVKRIYGPENYY